jgi:hypothetical protein
VLIAKLLTNGHATVAIVPWNRQPHDYRKKQKDIWTLYEVCRAKVVEDNEGDV